ncbi:uncharacterized protein LOC133642194 [Entelurus aequoreus]|uniref:uncharacterized protein LOC133642194 n=1 Tax=Entelurus aequoreus TaxID=161455 RepID=UPI002B1DBE46|nr:uncharacterized protein LOC133642194 [Entelurus aequoreus]
MTAHRKLLVDFRHSANMLPVKNHGMEINWSRCRQPESFKLRTRCGNSESFKLRSQNSRKNLEKANRRPLKFPGRERKMVVKVLDRIWRLKYWTAANRPISILPRTLSELRWSLSRRLAKLKRNVTNSSRNVSKLRCASWILNVRNVDLGLSTCLGTIGATPTAGGGGQKGPGPTRGGSVTTSQPSEPSHQSRRRATPPKASPTPLPCP